MKPKDNFLRCINLKNQNTLEIVTLAIFDGRNWTWIMDCVPPGIMEGFLNSDENKIDCIELIEE